MPPAYLPVAKITPLLTQFSILFSGFLSVAGVTEKSAFSRISLSLTLVSFTFEIIDASKASSLTLSSFTSALQPVIPPTYS